MLDHSSYQNKKIVLIIEDSPIQASSTQNILQEAGLTVLCAVNGFTGLRLAEQTLPHLIVLDIEMPDIDGFMVCEKLKQNPETAHIPVILLTRHNSPENFRLASQSGIVEFVPKDAFAPTVLIETIRRLGLIPSQEPCD